LKRGVRIGVGTAAGAVLCALILRALAGRYFRDLDQLVSAAAQRVNIELRAPGWAISGMQTLTFHPVSGGTWLGKGNRTSFSLQAGRLELEYEPWTLIRRGRLRVSRALIDEASLTLRLAEEQALVAAGPSMAPGAPISIPTVTSTRMPRVNMVELQPEHVEVRAARMLVYRSMTAADPWARFEQLSARCRNPLGQASLTCAVEADLLAAGRLLFRRLRGTLELKQDELVLREVSFECQATRWNLGELLLDLRRSSTYSLSGGLEGRDASSGTVLGMEGIPRVCQAPPPATRASPEQQEPVSRGALLSPE
jgi:hypothetical protein